MVVIIERININQWKISMVKHLILYLKLYPIIINVDNLEEINDIYGQEVVDITIEIVGQEIKNYWKR